MHLYHDSMVQPGMASYSPGMQRLSHGDGGSEPGHIEADVLSDEDDAEPLFKRQTFHDSLDRARRSASTIPHSAHSHHSNLLELQIEEMLREVRPNYSTIMGPLDTALRKLRTLIESIEDHEPLSVRQNAASPLLHGTDEISRSPRRQSLCTKVTKLWSLFQIPNQTKMRLIGWLTHGLPTSISLAAMRSRH